METFETHREVFPLPSSASTLCTETVNGIQEFHIKGYSPDQGVEIGNYITSNTFAVACDACVIYFSQDGTDCVARRTQGRLQVAECGPNWWLRRNHCIAVAGQVSCFLKQGAHTHLFDSHMEPT